MWLSRIAVLAAGIGPALVGLVLVAGCGGGADTGNVPNVTSSAAGFNQGPNSGEQGAALERLTAGGVRPATEDVLLRAYPDDPNTLNPITASDTVSAAFQQYVFETLAEKNWSLRSTCAAG